MFKKWIVLMVVLSCAVFAAGSGCSENGEEEGSPVDSMEEEDISVEEEDMDVEIISTGDSDEWCPVGSSWKTTNPQTGEEVTMEVTGTEVVDGVLMCKAVYETNIEEDDVSKVEYFWSEDGETVLWIAYDESGKMVSKFSMKDGKVTVVDEEGNVVELQQGS